MLYRMGFFLHTPVTGFTLEQVLAAYRFTDLKVTWLLVNHVHRGLRGHI